MERELTDAMPLRLDFPPSDLHHLTKKRAGPEESAVNSIKYSRSKYKRYQNPGNFFVE